MRRDLVAEVAARPWSSFQRTAIGVCVLLNMLDGYDILAMAFAAPGLKQSWGIGESAIGFLLSAGLVGMGAGSLVLGPVADRRGRRPVVLLSVAIAVVGMFLAAMAPSVLWLGACRVLTGFGIGGTIASVAVIVTEYAPLRSRSMALGFYATGYSIGATLGGALAAFAVPTYGWRSVFVIGGLLTLALWPLAARRLPESVESLLARRPAGALEAINRTLGALGIRSLDTLDDAGGPEAAAARASRRLGRLLTSGTLLAWLGYFATMAGFYAVVSWTPRLLDAAGLGAAGGLKAGVLLNLGGIAGCGLYGVVAARIEARRLLAASLAITSAAMWVFAGLLGTSAFALAGALVVGLVANAAMAGLYAVGPQFYPTELRASGMGFAIGIGRIGAILAPSVSGLLREAGWLPEALYRLYALPFALAALVVLALLGRASGARPVAEA